MQGEHPGPWALAPDEALDALGGSWRGLGDHEAAARLERYGRNRLERVRGFSRVALALKQFRSPLIYVLLLAAAVSLAVSEHVDASVIGVVLLFNAVIGYTQEYRAERSLEALRELARSAALVLREGRESSIDAELVVPGDVVVLRAGEKVPADCRILESRGLETDESLLTGESVPVSKSIQALPVDTLLADRANMAWMGTVITRGRGLAVVAATGGVTALGGIAEAVTEIEDQETPLQARMTRLANLIAGTMALVGIVAFGIGVSLGQDTRDLFFILVTLAVSAIPEALPIVFTVALAVGVNRMASRNVIVRHLPAVETLGSCTVIGSDKTGTLTQNRMTVGSLITAGKEYEFTGTGYDTAGSLWFEGGPAEPGEHPEALAALQAATLANDASISRVGDRFATSGDPTEVALLIAAAKCGIEKSAEEAQWRSWAEIPFESGRQFAAVFRERDGQSAVFLKGAPEVVAEMCTRSYGGRAYDKEAVLAEAAALAARGQRVLAMARGELPGGPRSSDGGAPPHLPDLAFLGLAGMTDPPRPEAREAIRRCRGAGIRVVMITGDHARTAKAIAADLGIGSGPGDPLDVIDGGELAQLDDERLIQRTRETSVYARIAPEQKLRLVQAFQAQGHVVAVTGDGVNDAPALKAADIGVAMGDSGTEVAKEASEMVITDDNFASIYAAAEEGRFAFANIRKATFFTISSGVAEVIAVVSSIVLGFPAPFLPAQILWLNLVTNGVQDVALAFEPGEEDVMLQPPRPRAEGILSRLLYERTALAGIWMALGTLLLFQWQRDGGASLREAQTVALTTMVLFQVLHAHNARSDQRSVFRKNPLTNGLLFGGSLVAVALHVVALYVPGPRDVLRLEPLGASDWLASAGVAVTILAAIEVHKWVRRPRLKGPVAEMPEQA